MDLKIVFVTLCLCALAITPTEAGIPKCCVATKKHIPLGMLLNVQKWRMQQSSGACDISALILQVKGMREPVCAHPTVKRPLMWLQMRLKLRKQKVIY